MANHRRIVGDPPRSSTARARGRVPRPTPSRWPSTVAEAAPLRIAMIPEQYRSWADRRVPRRPDRPGADHRGSAGAVADLVSAANRDHSDDPTRTGSAPLPTSPCASTPGRRERRPRSIGSHPTDPVPPPWFLTTSTAFSAHGSQVYCNLLPAGVRCVSIRSRGPEPRDLLPGEPGRTPPCHARTPADRCAREAGAGLPRSAHTPRRIPLTGSRTASLRPAALPAVVRAPGEPDAAARRSRYRKRRPRDEGEDARGEPRAPPPDRALARTSTRGSPIA